MIDIREKVCVEKILSEGNHFFGYYDISPESPDGTKVLINKPPFIDHMPYMEDELEIGYVDFVSGVYKRIGVTTAWNFQEGCRLQWYDNEKVIFNIRDEKEFKACMYDIKNEKVFRVFQVPIYSISPKSQMGLTYSFKNNRYSYAHDGESDNRDAEGIWLVDLKNGDVQSLISLDRLKMLVNKDIEKHWVEHSVFNREGNKIFFYYRWKENGEETFHNELVVSDLFGNVEIIHSGFCSHAGWRGNNKITAWSRYSNKVNSIQASSNSIKKCILKYAVKVYHAIIKSDSLRQKITSDAYVLFDLTEKSKIKINNSDFIIDGHCTWSSDERYMLTDTYPDVNNNRQLMLYDSVENQVYLLGSFFSYPEKDSAEYKVAGIRCDLHPKWSYQERYIYFDSTHEGYRSLYRIDIEKFIK